jgi:hypothetical protein
VDPLAAEVCIRPGICLFSRQARTERGRVALNAEVKPDIEFLEEFGAAAPNELLEPAKGSEASRQSEKTTPQSTVRRPVCLVLWQANPAARCGGLLVH